MEDRKNELQKQIEELKSIRELAGMKRTEFAQYGNPLENSGRVGRWTAQGTGLCASTNCLACSSGKNPVGEFSGIPGRKGIRISIVRLSGLE